MKINFEEACKSLKEGKLLSIPTDTVYGLAMSMAYIKDLKKIYELKGREENKPILLLSADLATIEPFFPKEMHHYLQNSMSLWPGAFSLILPSRLDGFPTLGVRIPNHPVTGNILKETGPLFVSSANLSGQKAASSLSEVEHYFGKEFPVVDGGLALGEPSSIVEVKEDIPYLLREGALKFEKLVKVFPGLTR